eukprot:scaffold15644_cov23-Tisochrysis_lutea.AAC.1
MIGSKAQVICTQQQHYLNVSCICNCPLHVISQAVNIINVEGKQYRRRYRWAALLYAKNPDVYAMLRQPMHTHHTPLAEPVWASYFSAHFRLHAAA